MKPDNILIIDDDVVNIKVLVSNLKVHNFEILTALNGKMGIQQAKLAHPNLILLDINMPKMDGYEVCKHLKAIEQTKNIPIIFVSALNEAIDKVKAFAVGGVDYITKPFEKEELLARVNTHLNLQKLQTDLKQRIIKHELAEAKIQRQNEYLQQVINSLEHPFYVINTSNYQIELANSYMKKLGFQPQITCHALTHKNPKPCNSKNDPCPLEQVKRTKKSVVLEHVHFDNMGNPINVEVHGFPIFDENGEVTRMIEYSLNITDRKVVEQKLNQQNTLLTEKNSQLNEFTTQLEALQKEKLYLLNKAYEYFVPHQFLNLLGKGNITDIQLGDQIEHHMTILFADIREFTTFSETMTPQENFNFINSFLGLMEPIIAANNGFIDKYIGDAIMALFSNADDAVQAGNSMLEALVNYNQSRQSRNYQPIKIGIGINSGSLMLGIIGSENRMSGTVISDAVNIASRMESLTKVYHTPLLISATTHQELILKDNIRLIDIVKVKGKSESINIFEVFTADSAPIKAGKLATLKKFEQAVCLYHEQNFIEAQNLFESFDYDATANIYQQRCQRFLSINTSIHWQKIAEKIKWSPDLSINNNLIDEQHKELFIRIKDLIMSLGNNENTDIINKTIDFLKKYVITHFDTEEQLMLQCNYPEYKEHKAKHTYFIQNFTKIEKDYKTNGIRLYLTLRIQEELFNWLINHITHIDQKLGLFLKEHCPKSSL